MFDIPEGSTVFLIGVVFWLLFYGAMSAYAAERVLS